MKITKLALTRLIKESIDKDIILRERPWSVEYSFKLSGGIASDSEGEGPDGFQIILSDKANQQLKIVVDTYWNPQAGDQSGNSIKIVGVQEMSSYVPFKMDDGKEKRLIISNSPVAGMITVSLKSSVDSLPVVYLVATNPFEINSDISFDVENLGNGKVNVELVDHVNF